jgi:hypothetical protein
MYIKRPSKSSGLPPAYCACESPALALSTLRSFECPSPVLAGDPPGVWGTYLPIRCDVVIKAAARHDGKVQTSHHKVRLPRSIKGCLFLSLNFTTPHSQLVVAPTTHHEDHHSYFCASFLLGSGFSCAKGSQESRLQRLQSPPCSQHRRCEGSDRELGCSCAQPGQVC